MSEAQRIVGGLPEERLHDWVLEQRWFASKAREVGHLGVLEAITLREEAPSLVLALVEARFHTGTHELYQVPLGLRPAADGWDDRVVGEVEGWTIYDALADAAHGRELLHRVRSSADIGGIVPAGGAVGCRLDSGSVDEMSAGNVSGSEPAGHVSAV